MRTHPRTVKGVAAEHASAKPPLGGARSQASSHKAVPAAQPGVQSYSAAMRRLTFLVASLLAACTGARATTELPRGQWGGEHVSMAVTATGASLEFDCAHGTVDEAPLLGAQGQFNLRGAYVRGHGGPIRQDEPEDRHPAQYSGQLQGPRVRLSIRLTDDGTQIGPFEAVLGQPPRLFKCL